MNGFAEHAERAALRGVAHLLPERWRRVVDLVAEEPPATPSARVPAPDDPAAARLAGIDHIVVVMMENRSFDHMLGYLSLPARLGGRDRTDIDGLAGPEANSNPYLGVPVPIHHLDRTTFSGEVEDPDHSAASVDEQLDDDGSGFVKNFARISAERAAASKPPLPVPDPGLVMGYYDAADLPVYDHLAGEYCVVDRWFSSVPGATWPNRLYSITGRAAGSRDDAPGGPIYSLPSFPRYLDEDGVDWRWYSFDPGTLRGIDPAYRLSNHHRFAFVDKRKLSTRERAAGELTVEEGSFLDDVARGELPSVSWIDPHFKDLSVLGANSNDDHPPSDVTAGQELVLTVYHALSSSPVWARTLLVIVYDEHGGFYDHVPPPAAPDDGDAQFGRLGVRVPALLVSPLVARGTSSTRLLGSEVHFDHTSILKTILTRFCNRDGRIPKMTDRVAAANHLGHLLADGPARSQLADHSAVAAQLRSWRAEMEQARFADPVGWRGAPGRLTDFQTGFYETARLLRDAGLPAGHP